MTEVDCKLALVCIPFIWLGLMSPWAFMSADYGVFMDFFKTKAYRILLAISQWVTIILFVTEVSILIYWGITW